MMRTPRDVRAELALAEQRRRERRAAADADHAERTRHSLAACGHERGFVRPTAETEARLRPDPISWLVANETLTREQGRAAVEIRDIYERVAAGLLARAGDMVSRASGGRPQMPERIALLHAQRYLPWVHHLGGRDADAADVAPARPARAGRCPPALEVTIDVVVESRALAACDRARRWRNGTAARLLAYALMLYTDLAGWESNAAAIASFEAWWGKRRAR
jgi:hypothetical protein